MERIQLHRHRDVNSEGQDVGATAVAPMVVLVTIHGIGFQVSPEDAPEGYADPLHRYLTNELGTAMLSPDPNRSHRDPQQIRNGAVYVQSHWPAVSEDAEQGLSRLDEALRTKDQRIAHVALVYSHLEEMSPKPFSLLAMLGQGLFRHRAYGKMGQLIGWIYRDGKAAWQSRQRIDSPSLQPRRLAARTSSSSRRIPLVSPQRRASAPTGGSAPAPSGSGAASSAAPGPIRSLFDTVGQLENDFAVYVLRNDLRERVRGFVREALVRLAERRDVEAIVINAHSQGTAVAFDVLAELPQATTDKIVHLVTSGSHLRKLVDLFNWGSDIGNMPLNVPWTNFYDLCDPVADGLCPEGWPPGRGRDCPETGRTLLNGVEIKVAGATRRVVVADRRISDIKVDNIAHSNGSLRAHNYFDNTAEFVPALAGILRTIAATPKPAPPASPTPIPVAPPGP